MVLLILPPGIRSSLSPKETIIRSSMILLIRIIVTSPFATKRLPDLPPFNSLMGKDSLAMLMIKVSGKVLPFKRMVIGRILSFGLIKACSSLKLPTSSLPMGGVLAKPMKALRW